MMSFTPTGTPCSGPRVVARSSARACASASSGSMLAQACTTLSRAAMRSRQARVTASQVISPAVVARTISVAVSLFRSVAALRDFDRADGCHATTRADLLPIGFDTVAATAVCSLPP